MLIPAEIVGDRAKWVIENQFSNFTFPSIAIATIPATG